MSLRAELRSLDELQRHFTLEADRGALFVGVDPPPRRGNNVILTVEVPGEPALTRAAEQYRKPRALRRDEVLVAVRSG